MSTLTTKPIDTSQRVMPVTGIGASFNDEHKESDDQTATFNTASHTQGEKTKSSQAYTLSDKVQAYALLPHFEDKSKGEPLPSEEHLAITELMKSGFPVVKNADGHPSIVV